MDQPGEAESIQEGKSQPVAAGWTGSRSRILRLVSRTGSTSVESAGVRQLLSAAGATGGHPEGPGWFNSHIRGWINYYGRYYKSARYPTLRHIDLILARWAHRKFESLRRHRRQTAHWIARVARRQPSLFAHWGFCRDAAGQWEPDEARVSPPVLRARGGEIPPRDSPHRDANLADRRVGLFDFHGEQKPAVRVQVNPDKIAELGLSLEDIRTVLGASIVNEPKGNQYCCDNITHRRLHSYCHFIAVDAPEWVIRQPVTGEVARIAPLNTPEHCLRLSAKLPPLRSGLSVRVAPLFRRTRCAWQPQSWMTNRKVNGKGDRTDGTSRRVSFR